MTVDNRGFLEDSTEGRKDFVEQFEDAVVDVWSDLGYVGDEDFRIGFGEFITKLVEKLTIVGLPAL